MNTLSRNFEDSLLEINWGPNCTEPPTSIGVYRTVPTSFDAKSEVFIYTGLQSYGYVITDIKFGDLDIPGGWNRNELVQEIGSKCLPFYIASFKNRKLLTIDCIKTQPNWMSENVNIHNIPLSQLFIPGKI